MLQSGRELPADVRRILRITHSVGGSVKAADAAVPSVSQLATLEHIRPIQSLESVSDAERPLALVLAGSQDEVCGRTLLGRPEFCAGSALDDLDALDRIVIADERAVIQEGQERGAVDRRTLDHGREIGRIAAAIGEAG